MTTKEVKERQWATQGDREVTKALIEWYAYFQDSKTGEIYKVRCSDGEYFSRGPYKKEIE